MKPEQRPHALCVAESSPGRPRALSSASSSPPRAEMLRHRSLDSVQASVEFHRSTSGRSLRLRQVRQEDGGSPMALTPRAPPGKRPPSGRRPWDHPTERQRGDNNSDEAKRAKERRSSFSISPTALKELERMRQLERTAGLEQKGKSVYTEINETDEVDESEEDEIQRDEEDEEDQQTDEQVQEHIYEQEQAWQEQEPPAFEFPLWKRATKTVRLPHALVNTPRESNNDAQEDDTSLGNERRKSRESESIQVACEMVSKLHVEHSIAFDSTESIGATSAPLSLTKSVSPRIGGGSASSSIAKPVVSHSTERPNSRAENPITKWKRGELIGAGTFGKVYVGLNGETGELFALKEIEIRAMPSADQMKQMHKLGDEIALMKNLSHKHIVRYKGSHRTDKHFCIFMEYVPGGSIASVLKQFDAFDEDLIRIFTRQIVKGVVYLHSVGVVHRDIKGANVLVNEQGVSKLADFGCSKQIPQLLTTSLEESLRSIRGSIPWMAPEVVKQERHGYKADIWSIGATVIEMATAKHPWPDSSNGLAAMYAIATATAPPPLPAHLSSEALDFLRRCFCINPDERATAAELLQHPFLAER